jgi:hypothetical protein
MNFTEIVALVLDKHKRPDKLVDTQRAVNAAVLFYSTQFDYERDLVESVLTISPSSYTHEVDISALSRFRKVDYLKYAGTASYIKKLESRVLSSGCDTRDKWYIAGTSLKINMMRSASALDFSYYQYPPVLTDAAPNYWMLQGNWEAIAEKAASRIFTDIGDENSSIRALQDATAADAVFRGDYVRSNQHS